MIHLHGLNGNGNTNNGRRAQQLKPVLEELSLLKQGGGSDTVSFSGNKSERFAYVRAELAKNVPDRTTTIEEKEKAIYYIDRMLNCYDITPELKNYWANKKDIIQMEIQKIKNNQQAGNDSDYMSLYMEYKDFIRQHWCDNYPMERNQTLEFTDSEEYGLTYYNTCISYLNRILACDNVPDNARESLRQEINHFNAEKQSRLGEINWHNQNRGIKTESYKDVLEEMKYNVPDRTTTTKEKKLAACYIKRMILCDDIPQDVKDYWNNKKNVIEMEMRSIENEEQTGKGEKWQNVAKEFSDFTDKYWVKNVLNDEGKLESLEFNDANEYYITVRRTMLTFCNRILACSDLPDDMKEHYQGLVTMFKCDLNSYRTQANYYNKNHNQKTESFYDVFAEAERNVPSSTTTLSEKHLAQSYIIRMLSCDDIPNAGYWQDKLNVIKKEIEEMEKDK